MEVSLLFSGQGAQPLQSGPVLDEQLVEFEVLDLSCAKPVVGGVTLEKSLGQLVTLSEAGAHLNFGVEKGYDLGRKNTKGLGEREDIAVKKLSCW